LPKTVFLLIILAADMLASQSRAL